MKKILSILIIAGSTLISSCNDWLDVLPKNEQVTAEYWKSKEDVEAVLASGYYYMRTTVPYLIDWGELRGGSVTTANVGKMKISNFQLTADLNHSSWSTFYQVINMANSVLKYAPGVVSTDDTYRVEAMNSHLTEAYFMRALMYFYLVRNFKEVPLILSPYVDDSAPYEQAKSTENEIIAQIKSDVRTALETGAAKEYYDQAWASKGRATKWGLYALMADVCLWSEDYDECIVYANNLMEANATFRPVFMSVPEQWFLIFNPGNSNESIFEMNWDYSTYGQTSNSPSNYYLLASTTSNYVYSASMTQRLIAETTEVGINNSVRSFFGAFVGESNTSYEDIATAFVWKYQGTELNDIAAVRTYRDGNFIVYRMTDVMLMKAEALIWKGPNYWDAALDIINRVRNRANLESLEFDTAESDELAMLEILLNERDMELAAEGKRWYDLVRFGKTKNYKYQAEFTQMIIDNNTSASSSWLRSVLKNTYAWYLPILESEINANKLLVQNPYYGVTK